MIDQLTLDNFQGREGSSFWAMTDQGNEVAFILKEVEPLTVHANHPMGETARAPFSLLIKGPQGVALEQGLIDFRNEIFGDERVPIFIVAVGKAEEDGCLTYQAVFN
ncbi:MAG: hypothetical protein VXY99_16375 [Pseudomonadota bacterium]|nr:hypothetical protein [Pseudomonadota bacterium]MEC8485394.1 hypothetical protein [Pseudomonadota bacterium]